MFEFCYYVIVTFSVLFWNIWYLNQVQGEAKYNRLQHELNRLTGQYQPDIIALSEVVRPPQHKSAPIIEYLQKLGYSYNYCATMAKFDDYWMSGVALCSRFPISHKQKIIISENGYATKHGHPGLNKEVIGMQVTAPKGIFKVIVAHPCDTVSALNEHRVGMNSLAQLVRSKPYDSNTILVGDMNQWRFMPQAFKRKVTNIMNSQTGSILQPTWRYNAHRYTLLRLNLDYVYWSKKSNFYLKDFKVLSSNNSDHRPLLATFEYK